MAGAMEEEKVYATAEKFVGQGIHVVLGCRRHSEMQLHRTIPALREVHFIRHVWDCQTCMASSHF